MTGKEVQKWGDNAMYAAAPIDVEAGPKVYLLWMTPDPLGAVAATCKIYKGEVVRSLADVADVERLEYFAEVQKTHLKAPLEFVQFHFMIEGVTRAFTHQMVRQRTAAYAQESLRFAVKEDMPVALPASLRGSIGAAMRLRAEIIGSHGHLQKLAVHDDASSHITESWKEWEQGFDDLPEIEKKRYRWDIRVKQISQAYLDLIDDGMPAEDARGLLPHNVLTRLHYTTNLRNLLEHAGNRLCTQAQFEWRLVFSRIAEAIRNYDPLGDIIRHMHPHFHAARQQLHAYSKTYEDGYAEIADMFRPICYQTGKCEFKSAMDRPCKIRDRVDANHEAGRPSVVWDSEHDAVVGNPIVSGAGPQSVVRDEKGVPVFIGSISPIEWLADPEAAR